MKHFSRKVLAVAVTTCLCSAAGAADKVPTLGDIFKASGVDASGYIDFAYSHLSTDNGSFTGHTYDTQHSNFNLHSVDTTISSLPSSGFGGLVELTGGSDAAVNASRGTGATNFDVHQAFLQYAHGPVTVLGGHFFSLAGAESQQAPNNTNYSRSFLFGLAEVGSVTGVRANYALSDAYTFTVGINNGWDIVKKSACGTATCPSSMTAELGVSATPIKMLSLSGSYYMGQDASTTTGSNGDRKLLDLIATVNISDAMNVVLNYDNGEQENAVASGTAKWNGLAGYFNYKFNDTWRVSVRAESFDDKQGFRTGFTQKLKEGTVTVGYAPAKNAELRGEVRKDKSDQTVFTEASATPNKKEQTSLGLEAVLKF